MHMRTSLGVSVAAKLVLYGLSKVDTKTILMTNGSLIKVRVLENARSFCNTFDLH